MDKLNTDCLLRIFVELTFRQKVQLERTCKRWMRILRSHHAHADIQAMNIVDYLKNSSLNYFQQETIDFVPTVVGTLSRCGPVLRELNFGSAWFRLSKPIVQTIGDYGDQITKLDLGCSILCADLSPVLDKIAPKLTHFSIEECNLVAEENAENIGSYFKHMMHLEEVNLRKCRINMDYILDLPTILKSADLSGIHHLTPELMTCFLIGHPQIKSLTLNPLPGAQFPIPNLEDPTNGLEMVFECIAAMKFLEYLSLGNISYDSTTLPMNCLAKLTTLRSLELKDCIGITGHSLKEILENIKQLESLTVINCAKICDYTSLGSCAQLKKLLIEKTHQVCDEDIEALSKNRKLEKLVLRRCYNITSKSIESIAFYGCSIKELDLSFCDNINDNLFDVLSVSSVRPKKLLLDGCKVTNAGIKTLCTDGKQLLRSLVELDLSHNKYVDNECISNLIQKVGKMKRIRTPLTIYLSQTNLQPEQIKYERTSKRIELIF